ncbi:MAG TPA: LacI family DNA-binding transcriptional regulator [Streptosporangiaceae bacterium]|nr:LacI family DNA-binding transcriptional regulator [Streptosporangiaceae bacterium]
MTAQQRGARLVDIAAAAGVHHSTVSRVLNGDPAQSVRPETYERIMRAARQVGYRPNALARALKRSRTGAIVFVIPMLRNPIWSIVQRGALQRAAERGYFVMMIEEPTEDPRPPAHYRYLIDEMRADGLLLATAERMPEHTRDELGVPHVYVNRRGPRPGHNVVMDEAGAVRMFLDHVAGLGHRHVALIDCSPIWDTVYRRTMAARRLSTARGITLTVRHTLTSEEGGWEATTKLLRGGNVPTACGVGNLNQVFGVLGALREAGVRVPEDMSVVSFDEDACLAYLDVPVTSIQMPLAELGAAAVDALIARIERTPATDVLIREPMTLVPRASVAAAPAVRSGH